MPGYDDLRLCGNFRRTMPTAAQTAGKRLRALRESLGLSMSEVERRTRELATLRHNPRLRVPKGSLSDIETKGRTPGIHCLYALAQAYRCDVRKLLGFYGLV
jgi:transcriptional regulator with XRE-family HTH domain